MATAMTWLARLGKGHMFVWAWGINGCFSVVGAAAVPLIATNFGLSAVIELSAAAYLLAIPAFFAVIKGSGAHFGHRQYVTHRVSRRRLLGAGLSGAAIVWSRGAIAAATGRTLTALVPFRTAPFPYDGDVPDTGQPFLDVEQAGRRGHTSPRGGIFWQDQTYGDSRVLLHVPAHFDPHRPGVLVVYLHGNNAELSTTVVRDQQVVAQFDASGINGLLVAPQLAVNAFESSAGRFWLPGEFAQFLAEAAERFGKTLKAQTLPLVIVAYSGGYDPAAYALTVGGVRERVARSCPVRCPVRRGGTVHRFHSKTEPLKFFLQCLWRSDGPNERGLGLVAPSSRCRR